MSIPKQNDLEIPLLEELEKSGGKARPQDLCPRIAYHFPELTPEDLEEELATGGRRWANRIQWARHVCVDRGEIDKSTRGVWAITDAGRERLRAYRCGATYTPPKKKLGQKKPKDRAKKAASEHDEVAQALEKIGKAFGFDTEWKPKVNALRPDGRAFKSKRKTLDVAWQIANLAWVPIEVQVGGSVPDLIYRFQQVHQWSLRLVVVTVKDFEDEIKEAIHDYPFRDKVVVLNPDKVLAATRSLDRLLELKAAIFE